MPSHPPNRGLGTQPARSQDRRRRGPVGSSGYGEGSSIRRTRVAAPRARNPESVFARLPTRPSRSAAKRVSTHPAHPRSSPAAGNPRPPFGNHRSLPATQAIPDAHPRVRAHLTVPGRARVPTHARASVSLYPPPKEGDPIMPEARTMLVSLPAGHHPPELADLAAGH